MYVSAYEQFGGERGVQQLVDAFYDLVYADPILLPLFPEDQDRVKQHQFEFLTQLLGGPKLYSERRGGGNLAMIHHEHPISETHAGHWLGCMEQALKTVDAPESIKRQLFQRLIMSSSNVIRVCSHHFE